MIAHKCPVCGGNGQVMAGFYNQVGGTWTGSSAGFEQCRSCAGSGVVWEQGINLTPQNPAQLTFPTVIVNDDIYIPCTCPPLPADGRPYIGDNFCQKHKSIVICGQVT